MFGRTKAVAVPEVGGEAPAFNLPSAQGGQLRLSMRTARGPVVVVFYEGPTEEEVAYFTDLASKEDEINMAAGSIVGIGIAEPTAARDFVEKTGMKSYVLYDYARVATREYGLLQKDKKRGEYARPATFVIDGDHKVVHAWVGERPGAADVLAAVSGITGLPKPAEEAEEKPEEAEGEAAEKPKKMSAEERERIKAERRAAREAGKTLKTTEDGAEAGSSEKPARERLSPEEREKRRAERRAAREADGESAEVEKKPAPKAEKEGGKVDAATSEESGEKAEARDAREAGEEGSEGEKTPTPEAGGEGGEPKSIATEETGEKGEAGVPTDVQAGASEETGGENEATGSTGARAAAEPAEGGGSEGEASGGHEPGETEGKAAKGG